MVIVFVFAQNYDGRCSLGSPVTKTKQQITKWVILAADVKSLFENERCFGKGMSGLCRVGSANRLTTLFGTVWNMLSEKVYAGRRNQFSASELKLQNFRGLEKRTNLKIM